VIDVKKVVLAIVITIIIIATALYLTLTHIQTSIPAKIPKVEGKKVLIVLFEGYQPKEYQPVREVLERAGATIDVLAMNKTIDIPYRYYIIDIEDKLSELATKYDAIVIIGGPGVYVRVVGKVPEPGLPHLEKLCRLFHEKGKVVAAICAAPAILAKAGILKGLRATCYPDPALVKILREGGAEYIEKAVIVDDNVVTAWGPPVAKDFVIKICEVLSSKK